MNTSKEFNEDKITRVDRVKHFAYEHYLAQSLAIRRLSGLRLQTLASVFLITFSLSLLFIFTFVLKSTYEISSQLKESSSLTIYPDSALSPQALDTVEGNLKSLGLIKTVQRVTPQRIYEEVFDGDLPGYMYEALPTLFQLTLEETIFQTKSHEQLYRLKQSLEADKNIEKVDMDLLWYQHLGSLFRLGQIASSFIGLVLFFTVIVVINYTVRMMLEKHREEIGIYQDLGANASFIQRPYLYQGLILSIVGTLLTLSLLLIVHHFLQEDLISLETFLRCSLTFSQSDLLFLTQCSSAVIFFAFISSWTTIRKWLYAFEQQSRFEKIEQKW